jgi:hypothetical protein
MAVQKLNREYTWWLVTPMLLVFATNQASGQPGIGTLHVSITDKETEKIVPALVCITSKPDNTWRVPPDGTIVNQPGVTPRQQCEGWAAGPGAKKWSPGDPGPVRPTVNTPVPGVTIETGENLWSLWRPAR